MAETSKGTGTAFPATVRVVNGPVPSDDPSHALRLSAAKDLVRGITANIERMTRELKTAAAELARLTKE